jgi:hypothetical protein
MRVLLCAGIGTASGWAHLRFDTSLSAGKGVVRTCRNMSVTRGGVGICRGASCETGKCDKLWRDEDMRGAGHREGGALGSEAVLWGANRKDCGAGGNRGNGAGLSGIGRVDVCVSVRGGGTSRGIGTDTAGGR